MNLKMYCPNEKCGYDGEKPYQLDLRAESYMDVNNIATIYCPHCKEPLECLKKKEEASS